MRRTVLRILVAAFCSCSVIICRAQAPIVDWAKQSISSNHVSGTAVALDRLGNTFVAGSISGTATFDATTVNGPGGFLAKYDPFGNVIWAARAGATNADGYNNGVASDAAGNVYLIGIFQRAAIFGGLTITNADFSNQGFVAKADSSGNFLWAKPLVSSFQLYLKVVAADTNGYSFVTGRYDGDATFGTNLPNSAGFVAKLDTNGTLLWVSPAGGAGNGVALDGTGSVYVAGAFGGTAVWGNGASQTNLTGNAIGGNMFLAKFDEVGNLVWVSSNTNAFGFSGQGSPLAVTSSGLSFITGLQNQGTASYVCKYSAAGNPVWLKFATNVRANSIALDSFDNVYVTGGYDAAANFSGTSLDLVSGNQDIFLTKYDSAGNLSSLNGFGGSDQAHGVGMAVSGLEQKTYLTGWFNHGVTFGDFTLTTNTNAFGFFLVNLGVQASAPQLDLSIYFGLTPGLTIHGFVGRVYQIEFTDSFQTNWHPWVRFPLPSSPYTLFDPSPSPSMRFYRAALVKP